MKTLLTIFTLVFTLMFSSNSFAEEKFVCNGWIAGDKSGYPTKFNLKVGRDQIFIMEDRDRPEIGMKWKLIHKVANYPIAMYASNADQPDHQLSTQKVEYVTLIRKKGTKDVELHKWWIWEVKESETSFVRKDYNVEHWSGLSFTQCYSF